MKWIKGTGTVAPYGPDAEPPTEFSGRRFGPWLVYRDSKSWLLLHCPSGLLVNPPTYMGTGYKRQVDAKRLAEALQKIGGVGMWDDAKPDAYTMDCGFRLLRSMLADRTITAV